MSLISSIPTREEYLKDLWIVEKIRIMLIPFRVILDIIH
jgi:hypothetical protein